MSIPQNLRPQLERMVRPESTGKEELVGTMRALDETARDPEQELPARLRHFLQGRSYHKALAFLDDYKRKTHGA